MGGVDGGARSGDRGQGGCENGLVLQVSQVSQMLTHATAAVAVDSEVVLRDHDGDNGDNLHLCFRLRMIR
jgi:hypothetical protein